MELLERRWVDADSMLCVGLDPDPARLPRGLRPAHGVAPGAEALFGFCRDIVDATADLVCAFKPQVAYFAAFGHEAVLAELIAYIHDRHPQVPVILDAKRGDIGATARLYAQEAFERFGADAVTINPYPGKESVLPYLDYPERGIILLCRTSNADSGWLQAFPEHDPVYLRVARGAVEWNRSGNLMLVAGATYADDLCRIREAVGDMPLLVPGIGAQGGDLAAVMRAGLDSRGAGLVISSSREILFASAESDFAAAARAAAQQLRDRIRALRSAAPRRNTAP